MTSSSISAITHSTRPPPIPVSARDCLHCGQSVPSASATAYCCVGCETVHQALRDGGLLRYYSLRGERDVPVGDLQLARRDRLWVEPLADRLAAAETPLQLTLAVQGLRCAACVWLIQELFQRASKNGGTILVNVGRGTLSLHLPSTFPLRQFVADVERFGYLLGTARAHETNADDLLIRLGVCAAIAANTMMFSLAVYLGLPKGALHSFLHALSFGLTTVAVLVGAPVFLRSAWHALHARLLHLDVPIAAGILLTYAAACWSFISGATGAAYYDSLSVFIALMLLGRYLQTRIVANNQTRLLATTGAEALMTRRVEVDVVTLVAATEVREGDVLLISAGELVPVACTLVSDAARCALDWISGESDPIGYVHGALIPAGAFNVGDRVFMVRATEAFSTSTLRELLATPDADESNRSSNRGDAFARVYVPVVVAAATGGLGYWWWATGTIETGLSVATAVCVVTCPCAIGIATPLAHDLVLGRLRRAGLFVRSATLLDRLTAVTRVVFDKTGTLTTGRLRLATPQLLDGLHRDARDVLYTMSASSGHPKSVAIHRALSDRGGKLLTDADVIERAGDGLTAKVNGREYRLGRRAFVTTSRGDGLCFGVDGGVLLELSTIEDVRHDSAQELRALSDAGYETWILSGDDNAHVDSLARDVGIAPHRALGQQSPTAKQAWIKNHDHHDTLMVGDGINDSLAVREAYCSGTPSIDRAFMPGRTDFYFVTSGLAPITIALSLSRRLARVTRLNQWFAITYNVGAVGLSLAGVMRPWMAATLMPMSSLLVLAWTGALLRGSKG